MKIEDKIKEIGSKLTANDFKYNQILELEHADGTQYKFTYALVQKYQHYLLVFTEHNKYHYFDIDDLNWFDYYIKQELEL